MRSKHRLIFTIASTLMIFTLILSGCSSKSASVKETSMQNSRDMSIAPSESKSNVALNNDAKANNGSAADTATKGATGSTASTTTSTTTQVQSNEKIIQSISIVMETKTFDTTTSTILDKISAIGGYVESSNISGTSLNYEGTVEQRRGTFKLRIPKANYDKFILDVGNLGNIINRSSGSENVTLQYFDNEARLKSLQVQEQRLLDILKSTGTLKDMLEIEKELANVRYQMENLTTTQKKLENLVDYATANIDVLEVQKVQEKKVIPVSQWEKMKTGFVDSIKSLLAMFKGLLIAISVILPYVVMLTILGIPTYYIWKKFFKNKVG